MNEHTQAILKELKAKIREYPILVTSDVIRELEQILNEQEGESHKHILRWAKDNLPNRIWRPDFLEGLEFVLRKGSPTIIKDFPMKEANPLPAPPKEERNSQFDLESHLVATKGLHEEPKRVSQATYCPKCDTYVGSFFPDKEGEQ